MACTQLVVLAALLVGAQCVYIGHPLTAPAVADPYYDPNPQYSYGYSVSDPLTGDSKSQQESRSGDVVQGSYSLVEPDGSVRIVSYAADPVSGFNAVVEKQPSGVAAPIAAPVAAPVAVKAAPLPVKALARAPIYSPYGYPRYSAYSPYGYPGYGYGAPLYNSIYSSPYTSYVA